MNLAGSAGVLLSILGIAIGFMLGYFCRDKEVVSCNNRRYMASLTLELNYHEGLVISPKVTGTILQGVNQRLKHLEKVI